MRGPRNHFELEETQPYVFIAGGIGITPILSMAASMPPDADWQLHYAGRSRSTMALLDEALALGAERVRIYPRDEGQRLDLDGILAGIDPTAAIYACGPPGLLKELELCRDARAPGVALHTERFVPSEEPRQVPPDESDDTSFEVELVRSNLTLRVPIGRSVLSVIRDAVPGVPFSCEEGYCGSCETRVVEGIPDHRDEILTEDEREASKTMMTCVSRSCTPRLVLDL
ncbi:PDR/VanB family oxidoreductase [Microbacterium rhizomatis]|uniref:PDR/VanB family oxidoreductase n=1 Tax=Microbacterium rhizomatis TaxID=1631477 RepID=UPI001FE75AFC|nr:PDR/VanB family oxidoreductase [Microbacterium rhizomatis]